MVLPHTRWAVPLPTRQGFHSPDRKHVSDLRGDVVLEAHRGLVKAQELRVVLIQASTSGCDTRTKRCKPDSGGFP